MRKRVGRRGRAFGFSVAVAMLGSMLAGCNTTGQGTTASLQPASGSTVAFDVIDGPPPTVFTKLVQKLNDEAQTGQVPVVSREGFANYRVRAYLAVGLEKKKNRSTVYWVWDVYDSQQQRAFRINGEEQVARINGDGWTVADDGVLGKIAHNGMQQLAGYLRGQPASAPSAMPSPQEETSPALAMAQAETD